jgi:WD40 repeat protein
MTAVGDARDVSASTGPYVGLNFYTQENAAIFFGRDRERTVLISNLRAARLTLLYAKSGTGKSSLLRAGVAASLTELAQRSFGQRGTARNIPVVFSSWRDDPTAELIDEIQEAVSPFLPADRLAALPPDRLEAAIEAASRATDATLLVILDQFEEYLLYRSREARDPPFADELAACLNRADLRAKVLISIREDAYFALGDLFKGRISNVYGNYFHLENLTREAAREAIEKPIASFNELHPDRAAVQIGPGLVDAVLDQFRPDQLAPGQGGAGRLAGGNGAELDRDEIEASYLQLVMKRLWDVEQEKRSATLRLATLEELGGAPRIVTTHVDRALGDLPDDERRAAVAILRHLVTPSRTKIALTAADLAEYTDVPAGETNVVLERLADSKTRILRPVPPPHGQADGTRFEISHDLLAPAILDWDRRQRALRLEQQKEAAEQQASTERRRARRSRFTASAAIAVALVAVLATVLAAVALNQRVMALRSSRLARSEGMAAEAINVLPANGPLAMLLSLQADQIFPTLQAQSALIQTVNQPLDHLLAVSSQVDSVAFSPDGRTLAVGDESNDVGLWSVVTGRRIAAFAEGSPADSVAFSPDGRTLAVGDENGNVGLFNVVTGRRIAALAEGNYVASVAFSPDGRTLAVGDDNGEVGLWNVVTGRRIAALAEGNSVASVAFSPDGRTLAVGDGNGDVGLWNVATGRRTALAQGYISSSVAFSPDGRTLAVGSESGDVGLWNAATDRSIAKLTEGSPVISVAFSPDSQTLAVGDYGGHVGLWSTATRQRTATLAQGSVVTSVAFSPDGSTLAVGDSGGHVGLWSTAAGPRTSTLTEGSPVASVAFSPGGRTLAVGDDSGDVSLWDLATGQRTATFDQGTTITSMAFSPNGRTLAVGGYTGGTSLWNVATGHRTTIAVGGGRLVFSVAFSPDGRTLAVGDSSGYVHFWAVAAGGTNAKIFDIGAPVASVAFSPGGRTLAVGDDSGDVSLWDLATGRRTTRLAVTGPVISVAFSPDGRTIAASDENGHVDLWNAATGRIATLGAASQVHRVAFSPTGETLVTGDVVGNVDIWNASDSQRFATLTEGGDSVTSLAFSSSSHGPVLAIGGLNGDVVLLWENLANLTQSYFSQLICGKVQENLTQAQWDEYASGQQYQKTCP